MSTIRVLVLLFVCIPGASCLAQTDPLAGLQAQADTLVSHDEFEKAVPILTKIVEQTKLQGEAGFQALYKRSFCYYRLERYEEAVKDLDLIITKLPDLRRPHLLRAYVYRELNDPDHQLEDLNVVLKDSDPAPDLMKWRASLLLDKDDPEGAMKDLRVVQQLADDAETETLLALAYQNSGDLDSAILSINNAIVLDPEGEGSYLYGASFCLQAEDFDLALKYLDVALNLNPGQATALLYKGVALVELKRFDDGCRCLTKAFNAGEDDAGDYLKEYCYGSDN